jgi:multiple sugar transport system permease protein
MNQTRSAKGWDLLIWMILGCFALLILTPLLFMFTSSIMPATEIMKLPYPWITSVFRWQNYWYGLTGPDGSFVFLRNIFNSLVVSFTVTFTTVILAALTGYGLSKFDFKGRNLVFILMMATMMIPFEVIMIPLYMVAMKLRIQDSYLGLTLPYS